MRHLLWGAVLLGAEGFCREAAAQELNGDIIEVQAFDAHSGQPDAAGILVACGGGTCFHWVSIYRYSGTIGSTSVTGAGRHVTSLWVTLASMASRSPFWRARLTGLRNGGSAGYAMGSGSSMNLIDTHFTPAGAAPVATSFAGQIHEIWVNGSGASSVRLLDAQNRTFLVAILGYESSVAFPPNTLRPSDEFRERIFALVAQTVQERSWGAYEHRELRFENLADGSYRFLLVHSATSVRLTR